MKPICVNCEIKMAHERSGVMVLETYEDGEKPYKVWSADLFSCDGCESTILSGFGSGPVAQEFDSNFQEWVAKCEFKFR